MTVVRDIQPNPAPGLFILIVELNRCAVVLRGLTV